MLRAGNTGTVNSGTENDSIVDNGAAIGSMQLFGGDGADTISAVNATGAQTIVGGNNSSDGADSLRGGSTNDLLLGNGGNDTLSGYIGNDTMVGGVGNDLFGDLGPDNELAFGNQGNDTFDISAGNDTIWGGLGDDSVVDPQDGRSLYFGNEGNDTVDASINFGGGLTVIGGDNSADGGNSILTGSGADLLFGNGGADTINSGTGNDTIVAGFGNDTVTTANPGLHLVFGNEGNDTINGAGFMTVFGGLGDNSTWTGSDTDTIQGNEGNDTIRGDVGIDTVAGGAGNDVFRYAASDEDGDNAAGGGPVEFITDVNWAEDGSKRRSPSPSRPIWVPARGESRDIGHQRHRRCQCLGGRRSDPGRSAVHFWWPHLSGDQPRRGIHDVQRRRRPLARYHQRDRNDRQQQLHLDAHARASHRRQRRRGKLRRRFHCAAPM